MILFMFRFLQRYLFLLFCATVLGGWLHAADNNTLLNAGVDEYRKLLKQLDGNTTQTDPLQTALQKALLQRLILLSETPVQGASRYRTLLKNRPATARAYRDYFHALIDSARQLVTLQKRSQQLARELAVLKKELNVAVATVHKKDPRTLRLQYAYSYRRKKVIDREITTLMELFGEIPDRFVRWVPEAPIEANTTRTELEDTDTKLQGLKGSAEDLSLEKERLTILGGHSEQIHLIDQGLKSIHQAEEQLLTRKAEDLFLLFTLQLKQKDKTAFKTAKELVETLKEITPDPEVANRIGDLLLAISQKRFGIAATLRSAAGEELQHTIRYFWNKANAPLFTINNTPISPIKILVTILIFTLGFIIAFFYKRMIQGISAHNFTEATKTLLSNMGYYLIILIAFFVALHFLGINLSSIALVAGALSVGIGFGLQNIVSNFISGIILMFERSIKIGDYIELGDNLSGRVTDVRMRSLTITTNANIDIIVPNQELIQNRVINWTMNDKIRRYEIPFGVAYGTEASRVISTVLEAVGRSGYEDIVNSKERPTQVIMTGMGDSSVDFTLFVWIKGPKVLTPLRTTSRFLIVIYTALNEAGIEIPFPQRDLHLRSVDTDVALPVVIRDRDDRRPDGTPDLSRA